MSDTSPNLNLPYILPAQAQKHVTHNQSLDLLDALVQVSVLGRDVNDPPTNPQSGDTWAIGSAPSGAWQMHQHALASFNNNGWVFVPLRDGVVVWDVAQTELAVWTAGAWQSALQLGSAPALFAVNASADMTNRFSVASDATLFSHDGAGHQMKLNKAGASDTASLLFQSGFSGRAEMGLSGSDAFSIKVSPDGTSWVNAMEFDAATGVVTGEAIQLNETDTSTGRLARADFVYGPGNLLGPVAMAGSNPSGAVIEAVSNANGQSVRWADGTMMCHFPALDLVQASATHLTASWTFPAGFVAPPMVTFSLPTASAQWTDIAPGDVAIVTQDSTATDAVATLHKATAANALASSAQITGVCGLAVGRWV